MRKKYLLIFAVLFGVVVASYFLLAGNTSDEEKFISYEVNLRKQPFQLYLRDDSGRLFHTIGNLKKAVAKKGRRLIFAMNAGMFKADHSAQGLFIQAGKTLTPLNTTSGNGNFYLKPNGVFYVTADQQGVVCTTEQFEEDTSVRYATQSGPMLLIDGKLHPAFQRGSSNVQIRNGVGILGNGNVLFVMSKKALNFYDFAMYFKRRGCRDALYLDGFVSRTYLPEKGWTQTEGNLGVLIGVVE